MRVPPCKHFAQCGGCSLQEMEYAEQIKQKEELLTRLFSQKVSVEPAPQEFRYRNRIDFIISEGKIGLRKKARPREVVDIEECLLVSEKVNTLFTIIKQSLLSSSLSQYSFVTYKGFLRYLSFREADNQIMVLLTTSSPSGEEEYLCKELISSWPAENVVWLVHKGKSDDVTGEPYFVKGNDELTMSVNSLHFAIGPHTFFQSNISVAQNIFSRIADVTEGSTLDLYCGVGAITLLSAKNATNILGVEEFPQSIVAAKKNAQNNAISNASFISDSAHGQLRVLLEDKKQFDTIIVDPPRTGIGLHVAKLIVQLSPKKIIYMSCNPRSLRVDTQYLLPYKLTFFKGYDMFPQTDHVECVAIFER